MCFLFFSLLFILFKSNRFIFVLISLEFFVMSCFFYFFNLVSSLLFFYFLVCSVVSSILGMLVMVCLVKFFGSDGVLFWSIKLFKLLVFKTKKLFL